METKVSLESFEVSGAHGYHEWERVSPQRFIVSVTAILANEYIRGTLESTLDYSEIQEIVYRIVVEGPPQELLEDLASNIIADILDLAKCSQVKVRIEKPDARLPFEGGTAVVEMIYHS